jgi:hypothetical protein
MDLDKKVLANAFALATVVLWVICSAIVYLLPDFTLLITELWMHGMDMEVMGTWNLTFTNFIWGGLTLTVSAWITGYIFGWSWERVSK